MTLEQCRGTRISRRSHDLVASRERARHLLAGTRPLALPPCRPPPRCHCPPASCATLCAAAARPRLCVLRDSCVRSLRRPGEHLLECRRHVAIAGVAQPPARKCKRRHPETVTDRWIGAVGDQQLTERHISSEGGIVQGRGSRGGAHKFDQLAAVRAASDQYATNRVHDLETDRRRTNASVEVIGCPRREKLLRELKVRVQERAISDEAAERACSRVRAPRVASKAGRTDTPPPCRDRGSAPASSRTWTTASCRTARVWALQVPPRKPFEPRSDVGSRAVAAGVEEWVLADGTPGEWIGAGEQQCRHDLPGAEDHRDVQRREALLEPQLRHRLEQPRADVGRVRARQLGDKRGVSEGGRPPQQGRAPLLDERGLIGIRAPLERRPNGRRGIDGRRHGGCDSGGAREAGEAERRARVGVALGRRWQVPQPHAAEHHEEARTQLVARLILQVAHLGGQHGDDHRADRELVARHGALAKIVAARAAREVGLAGRDVQRVQRRREVWRHVRALHAHERHVERPPHERRAELLQDAPAAPPPRAVAAAAREEARVGQSGVAAGAAAADAVAERASSESHTRSPRRLVVVRVLCRRAQHEDECRALEVGRDREDGAAHLLNDLLHALRRLHARLRHRAVVEPDPHVWQGCGELGGGALHCRAAQQPREPVGLDVARGAGEQPAEDSSQRIELGVARVRMLPAEPLMADEQHAILVARRVEHLEKAPPAQLLMVHKGVECEKVGDTNQMH
eukprot:1012793-Prymnesium_polylepis.2